MPTTPYLDQSNDSLVIGIVDTASSPSASTASNAGINPKYDILLLHNSFAQSKEHRDSSMLKPINIDATSVYPRVVSDGIFQRGNAHFCVNEAERFVVMLPHIDPTSVKDRSSPSTLTAAALKLLTTFMKSTCSAQSFVEHLKLSPELGAFKICVSDGSAVTFYSSANDTAIKLTQGIWSFDAYHEYVEIFALWQSTMHLPMVQTLIKQLHVLPVLAAD